MVPWVLRGYPISLNKVHIPELGSWCSHEVLLWSDGRCALANRTPQLATLLREFDGVYLPLVYYACKSTFLDIHVENSHFSNSTSSGMVIASNDTATTQGAHETDFLTCIIVTLIIAIIDKACTR